MIYVYGMRRLSHMRIYRYRLVINTNAVALQLGKAFETHVGGSVARIASRRFGDWLRPD